MGAPRFCPRVLHVNTMTCCSSKMPKSKMRPHSFVTRTKTPGAPVERIVLKVPGRQTMATTTFRLTRKNLARVITTLEQENPVLALKIALSNPELKDLMLVYYV